MKNTVKIIRFEDSLTAKICSFLRSHGYFIADQNGVAHNPKWEINRIGILLSESVTTSQSSLFGLIKKSQVRKVLLGYISLNEPDIGSTPDNWQFSFFDNAHEELVIKIANELSEAFNVNITIHPPTFSYQGLENFSDELFCDD